jgi:hypothetical protein
VTAVYQARYEARLKATDPAGYRETCTRKQAQFRRRYPEKKAAWNAVYKAVKSGVLTRPDRCEHCGVECKPDASHDDYAFRLQVEWLCRSCHAAKDTLLRGT